ncbi:hypothetical protein AXO1947_06360 [Xanthomonas oryzae pv. oryzae]|nr:hypothetical protein AXO1947_06360 [Xanthomonas oryzae pv. oryzae]
MVGFNYRTSQMDGFHAQYPNIPIYGSETGSTVSVRGNYQRDDKRGYTRAYDLDHPWWASTAEAWWSHVAQRPYIAGGFIWTGFDYRGEPTPYNRWPNVASQFGVLDRCEFPKDNYCVTPEKPPDHIHCKASSALSVCWNCQFSLRYVLVSGSFRPCVHAVLPPSSCLPMSCFVRVWRTRSTCAIHWSS